MCLPSPKTFDSGVQNDTKAVVQIDKRKDFETFNSKNGSARNIYNTDDVGVAMAMVTMVVISVDDSEDFLWENMNFAYYKSVTNMHWRTASTIIYSMYVFWIDIGMHA